MFFNKLRYASKRMPSFTDKCVPPRRPQAAVRVVGCMSCGRRSASLSPLLEVASHSPVLITALATFSLELASATWTSVPRILVQLDLVQLGVKSHESSSVLILSCDRLPEPVSRLAPFPTYLRPYRAVEDAYSTVSLVEHVDQPRSN